MTTEIQTPPEAQIDAKFPLTTEKLQEGDKFDVEIFNIERIVNNVENEYNKNRLTYHFKN